MLACVLQVARELQAVCRPNPKKSRESCRKENKHKRKAALENTKDTSLAKQLTFCVSSDSDVEILPSKHCSAMEQFPGPAEAYKQGPTCTVWFMSEKVVL